MSKIEPAAELFAIGALGATWYTPPNLKRTPVGTKLYLDSDVRKLRDRSTELERDAAAAEALRTHGPAAAGRSAARAALAVNKLPSA